MRARHSFWRSPRRRVGAALVAAGVGLLAAEGATLLRDPLSAFETYLGGIFLVAGGLLATTWRRGKNNRDEPRSPRQAPPITSPPTVGTFRLIRRSKRLKWAALVAAYIALPATLIVAGLAIGGPPSAPLKTSDWIGFGIIGGVVLLFAWNLLAGVREVIDARRIVDQGTPAHATITRVERTAVGLGRSTWHPGWTVSYRYHDGSGVAHVGQSGFLPRKEARKWRKQDIAVVLYDRDEPARSVWVGEP